MTYNDKSLLYKTEHLDDIEKILSQIQNNNEHRNGKKVESSSLKLWKLRRKTNINDENDIQETLLEKSIAILACRDHMPNWYNQVPTASGILQCKRKSRSRSDSRTNVDLAHWDENNCCLHLIELKWTKQSKGKPADAVRQILRYGAIYLFCREHKDKLQIENRLAMSANHVVLEVIANHSFYCDNTEFQETLSNAKNSLGNISSKLQSLGLRMALKISSFPKDFNKLPFETGDQLCKLCDTTCPTQAGKIIKNAFENRKPV